MPRHAAPTPSVDARHTAATVLVLGRPSGLSWGSLMGWSDSAIAMRHQHVTREVRRDIAGPIGGIFVGRWTESAEGDRMTGVMAAAETATTGWTEVAKGSQALVQSVAILIGGMWAYGKFVRGRTYHPRCTLSLEVAYRPVNESAAFRVDVTVLNSSLSAIVLPADLVQRLTIRAVDKYGWAEAVQSKTDPLWDDLDEEAITVEMLSNSARSFGDWRLEPAEPWHRSFLVPVPASGEAFQAEVLIQGRRYSRFRMSRQPHTWRVERVFTAADAKD